jgi:hypothetical protein
MNLILQRGSLILPSYKPLGLSTNMCTVSKGYYDCHFDASVGALIIFIED